eukprot:5099100-Amphidinium_carterae.1
MRKDAGRKFYEMQRTLPTTGFHACHAPSMLDEDAIQNNGNVLSNDTYEDDVVKLLHAIRRTPHVNPYQGEDDQGASREVEVAKERN